MKYRRDLILGEAFCIFIFFHFPDSGLSLLNDLLLIFDGVTVKTEKRNMRRNTQITGIPKSTIAPRFD